MLLAIPTITASGPLSFCLGDSVTLTSSTASHYTWSTGDTTQIITIKVAGNYTVTTPGLCAGVSMPAIVSLNSFLAPTITASGPLNLCIGDSVKLTASWHQATCGAHPIRPERSLSGTAAFIQYLYQVLVVILLYLS
ncbi:MAG: hypothetical protein IPP42_11715 [Saprospiraceae bacterium]|nr:hypothetical protein [Saprospiraceae bacterium]